MRTNTFGLNKLAWAAPNETMTSDFPAAMYILEANPVGLKVLGFASSGNGRAIARGGSGLSHPKAPARNMSDFGAVRSTGIR
jgi:hypothetical protein